MSTSPPHPCSKTTVGHAPPARYCLCAPTTHPGSFRCRLHRSSSMNAMAAAPSASEAKEAAAAAVARVFLERMTARKPRRQGVSGTTFLPGPSSLGVGGTATDG
ncbi:hypothetical protein Zm00014a_039928 [Zea mays]|uniref:Uncharacterized protein n=2 Tax=Zea mays TaxID=4577 RepID=A0A1D6H2Q1_MAIZE|nr:hypothetical protein ZEAMMB73_Zm00001d015558 [Zea mays]PWZ24151.1 hypothetical protein Zm00014a_039928 [Zea mays]|eukprot:XP_008646791.1 uncharacterized protein LOC103628353 [Zea mays]